MRIAVIGSGYVGLTSGVCFADFGHHVCCVDTDAEKIERLTQGVVPIFEPGLTALLVANQAAGRLSFSTKVAKAVADAEIVLIAVGTPSRLGDGHADLSFLHAAAREVGLAMTGFTVVVIKSTVPVGTGDEVERILRATAPDGQFSVVSNPEFLREGAAIGDFKKPDRIIIGAEDDRARHAMAELYRPLFLNQAPLFMTSRRSAELTKYAANAFLATKISFINEMADLCEKVGANVQDVARGVGLDNRIGPKFLHAGPGYGGSCFPKDTLALIRTAQDYGSPMRIVETVAAVNEQRKRGMARKVIRACDGNVRDKVVAVLGLTFKPNTDDMRDAPSIAIVTALQDRGARIRAYDPQGMEAARRIIDGITYTESAYDCAAGADALVIVTEWDAFRALDHARIQAVMRAPVMVDLRNVYRPDDMRAKGYRYFGVGEGRLSWKPEIAAGDRPVVAASARSGNGLDHKRRPLRSKGQPVAASFKAAGG
jgi:UDPglucose 6-dehydrogenase